MELVQSSDARISRVQTLSAVIIRACQGVIKHGIFGRPLKRCNAPGAWQRRLTSSELIRLSPEERRIYEWRLENWAETFTTDAELIGQPISGRCPCCGAPRQTPENKGEVWRKEHH